MLGGPVRVRLWLVPPSPWPQSRKMCFSKALISQATLALVDEHMLECFVGPGPVKAGSLQQLRPLKPMIQANLKASNKATRVRSPKHHDVAAPLPLCGFTSCKEE